MWEWYVSLYKDAWSNDLIFVRIVLCMFYASATFTLIGGILAAFWGFTEDARKRRKGRKFENKVKRKLEDKFHVTVYQGLLFPKGFDDTTELDLAFVSSKGIFCFECKRREAYHFICSPLKPKWGFRNDGVGGSMNNPLFQNKLHISALLERLPKNYLSQDYVPIFNIAALNASFIVNYAGSESSIMSYWSTLTENGEAIIVPKMSGLSKFYKEYNTLPDVLSEEDIVILNNFLQDYVATKKELKEHAWRRYHEENFPDDN